MRSSKSRSRNKSNRNRSVGNIVNRVFDSSGPEGKVRGTPQQIIDKYNQLARDAQLAGDRVATENFQQHAEHYLRLLGTAQKEQEKQREQQENENRKRQSERDRAKAQEEQSEEVKDPGAGDQPDVVEQPSDNSTLVETPEQSKDSGANAGAEPGTKPKRTYNRKPRAKKSDDKGDAAEKPAGDSNPAAAE